MHITWYVMSLRVLAESLLPRPCQSQRVASRTEWQRPGRWETTRAGSELRFCQGARPPRRCYSRTSCGSLWGCRRWTWRRLQDTEQSWILCLLGSVQRKKCELTNELWINLPTWCNIYCIISARHVSGLYARLQKEVDVIISYIYSIWCPVSKL